MVLPDRLDAALKRLSGALRHLDAAVQHRTDADAARGDLVEEFMILQDDRSRLASELDGALARSHALLSANAEVLARLDRAGATVEDVLTSLDGSAASASEEAEPFGAQPAGSDQSFDHAPPPGTEPR